MEGGDRFRPISTSNFEFGQFNFGQVLDVDFWDNKGWGPEGGALKVGPRNFVFATIFSGWRFEFPKRSQAWKIVVVHGALMVMTKTSQQV